MPAQTAREQIHGLMMASHNRCGASSPARHFVSLPPLATAPLWDWCLRDTEVVFGATTATCRFERRRYFTFGISSALSSVTRGLTLHNTWIPAKIPANSRHDSLLSCGLLVSKYADEDDGVAMFFLSDIGKPTEQQRQQRHQLGRLLLTETYTVNHVDGGNHKWWVHSNGGILAVASVLPVGDHHSHCNGNGNRNSYLVADASAHREGDDDDAAVVLSDVFADGNECTSISFNKNVPDEALLVILEGSFAPHGLILMVVDINETYRRRNLTV